MLLRKFAAALACVAASLASTAFALVPLPPTPSVRIAVNPVTNKVYAANKSANTVTVLDATTGTSTSIAVGAGPDFIAVDPTRNRVFVDNTRDASLTVIDGSTNAVIGTYNIGSMGPITIDSDPTSLHNVAYVMRMTSAATDEVTYFNPNNDAPVWYTVATDSFQPSAVAVNPATHTIFVTHYATGDLRIIDGTYSGQDFPHPPSIGMWSTPFAVAANPVTNKIYVTTEDSRGPIGVVNGATLTAVFPTVQANHAAGPKALVVNPVSNKAYAAFSGEVIVIDGATNALTYVPIANAGSGAISLGIDYGTNRIYAATELGTLSVIDGDTDTVVSSSAIQAGTSSIGVNPITHAVYLYGPSGLTAMTGATGTPHTVPITTTITPFTGNTSAPSNTFSLSAASGFAPTALPVRKAYYRIDSTTGPWTEATATSGGYSGSFSSLAAGSHTIYAFAVDDQVAQLYTGGQSIPLAGAMASYTFTVGDTKTTPTVSLASSANPANVGQSVTLTASVTGSSGTATGTMTFRDGTAVLCASVALSSGAATCATSTLAAGSHSITAEYSGDTHYNAATSSALAQAIAKWTATTSIASSANPANVGQSVTLTASVTGSSGTATGTMTFRDGTAVLCASVALSSGAATCATSTLAAGSHSITAEYSGDTHYNAATSSALAQAIAKWTATTSIASSANPSTTGATVTFTAAVTGGSGTPTGSITFLDGTAALCSGVTMSTSRASCSTSTLTAGNHSIVARYSGDATYNGADSSALAQAVNAPAKAAPTVAIASSMNPSTAGQGVSFTASVSGAAGTATGSVTFLDGGNAIGGCTSLALAGGNASCNAAALTAGVHPITAQYSGDAAYNAAVSATFNQTVNAPAKATPTVALVSSANPATAGAAVTFTATLSNAAGTPTGTVAFFSDASAIAGCESIALSGANASCSTAALAAGQHAIVAQYSGDGANNTASSATLGQQIDAAAAPAASLANISTRGLVGTGNDVLIGGFVIGGGGSKTVVVTAAGPSLTRAGVGNALANPMLTLVRSSDGAVIATNDDWQAAANAAQIQAAGFAPADSREPAIMLTLPAGAYTAIVSGVGGSTGVAVVGVFEADHPEVPLVNISTRGQVLTGNDVMIGGFVIQGSASQTVVVTGVGPSLHKAGIANALANPTLTLVRMSDQSVVAVNDDWQTAPNAAQITAAGFAPGDPSESAIMVTLPPGAYTAILSGAGGGTGVGIVAIYRP